MGIELAWNPEFLREGHASPRQLRTASGCGMLPGMSEGSQAEEDARTAWTYAINCLIAEADQLQVSGGRTPEDVFGDYAGDVLRELNGDRDRLLAAARFACIKAADMVAYPGRWRPALRAVELCQRAALMAEQPVSPS